MSDLKFGEDFSLETLVKRLQWEVPILPDFQVFVNGDEIESKQIENADKFAIDESGEHMGNVKGTLYLSRSNKKPVAPGIHVYVNGRAIGDPVDRANRFSSGGQSGGDRLVGIVNADGLSEAIMLGAETFQEDHPGVLELEGPNGVLKKYVLEARKHLEHSRKVNRVRSMTKGRGDIAEGVRQDMARKGFQVMEAEGSIRFAGKGELPVEVPSKYDIGQKVLLLNPDHPSFSVGASTSHKEIERTIVHSVIDGVAMAHVRPRQGNPIGQYVSTRAQLWKHYVDQTGNADFSVDSETNPIMLYSANDLSKMSKLPITAGRIRDAVEVGILESDPEGIKGDDFLEFEKRFHGFVSLYDVMYKLHEGGTPHYMEKVSSISDALGGNIRPFVYNVSRIDEREFYFIDKETSEAFFRLFGQVDGRNADTSDPVEIFGRFTEGMHDIDGLTAVMGRGFNPLKIPLVRDYAREHGLRLWGDRPGSEKINYADYVVASQIMRGCDWVRDYAVSVKD